MMLNEQLRPYGFKVVHPFTYQVTGGTVNIGTASTLSIMITGNDFCITDLFVDCYSVGAGLGADFRIRNRRTNQEFQNRISPMDTGTADIPTPPYQILAGQPSCIKLPWIVNAGDVIDCYTFARFVAIANFQVALRGYVLNTVGRQPPFLPYWYHFNGYLNDIAAGTFGITQEVTVSGPSDYICYDVVSQWDYLTANVAIQETLRNESTGKSFSSHVTRFGRVFQRPYDDQVEATLPVPFIIKNGSVLVRRVSNTGTAPTRRPEFTLFGFFKTG